MSLDELEKLAREATPGPWWVAGKATVRYGGRGKLDQRGWIADMHWRHGAANGRYIAAANPAEILRLVAIARAAEKALDFFTTYSSLNEGAQDDMAEEKESTLAALRLALGEKADG